jgi:DNA repair protein RadC
VNREPTSNPDSDYISFEDEGLMEELRESGAYELVAKDKAELKKVQLEAEKDKAVLETKSRWPV